MDINQPLDQAQIADAVNRQKAGTQRQRNEMMRLGTSDPNSFAMQNQKQLQEAQQPAEFWGAGRKIAEDQNPDLDAANTINPLVKLGGIYNYYGDTDSSSAKWGTPYGKTDIGGGKYNILGSQGQTLGTGYKSLQDSISEMYKSANAPTAVSKWKDYTGELDPTLFDTRYGWDSEYGNTQTKIINPDRFTEAGYRNNPNYQAGYTDESYGQHAAVGGTPYQKMFNGYDWKGSDYDTLEQANAARDATGRSYATGNNLRDWETLGQLLTQGNITGNHGQRNSFGGNQIADKISGLDTLYGSTPLVFKDKLYGFKNSLGDTTPLQSAWNEQSTESSRGGMFGLKVKTENKWDVGNSGMYRQYSDPNWWSQNVKGLNNNDYFITPDKATTNPGWTNNDYYQRNQGSQSSSRPIGGLSNFMSGVGAIVDMFVPWTMGTAKYVGANTASLIGGANFGDVAENSVKNQMPQWLAGGIISGLANGVGDYAGGVDYSAATNTVTPTITNQAINAAINAGGSALLSKDASLEKTLLSALAAGGGGILGANITDATKGLGQGLSNFFGGVAQGAAGASGKGSNAIINSALSSGVGRGLGGLFNDVSGTTDKKQQQRNIQSGQQAAKLAQLFRNNNGGKTTTGRKT